MTAPGHDHARTVLVVVDETEEAECAFEYYLDHVHQHENRIVLLQMAGSRRQSGLTAEDTALSLEDATRYTASLMEARYAHKLRAQQVSWRFRTVTLEEAAEVIVEEARTENVAMVTIGTRGVVSMGTGFGALPDYVIRHAHCPVVVLDSTSRDTAL